MKKENLDSPALLGAVRVFGIAVGLVTAPIITYSLEPSERGLFGAVVAIFAVLPIALDFGVSAELRRRLAISRVDLVSGQLSTVTLFAAIGSSILGILACLLLFGDLNFQTQMVVFAGALAASLGVRMRVIQAKLLDSHQYFRIFAIRIAQPMAYLVLLVVGSIFLGLSLELAIWANIISNLASFLVSKILDIPTPKQKPSTMKFFASSWLFGLGALGEFALFRGDQIAVLPAIGAKEAGLYMIATILLTLPSDLLSQSIAAAHFQRAANSGTEVKASTEALGDSLILGLVAVFGLLILAPFVIPIVFGEPYSGAVTSIFFGLFGSYLMVVFRTMSQMALSLNLRLTLLASCWLGFFVNMVALFTLASLGAIGASIASGLGYASALIILLPKLKINFKTHRRRWFGLAEALSNIISRGDLK